MEQDAVFDLGDFDAKNVNMNEPPRSAIQYLQQAAVERSRCSAVVCMNEDFVASVQPSSSQKLAADNSSDYAQNLPSEEWCKAKCSLFSKLRSEIEVRKPNCPKVKNVSLPSAADYKRWITFCCLKNEAPCLGDASDNFNAEAKKKRIPTIPLMLSMSHNRISYLVEHLTKYFLENGYSRDLFQWFYGVLLVLQNPPTSDECSAIREFAKYAKALRSTLGKEGSLENPLVYEFTLFVAIISMYFEQKDLADYPLVATVKLT